MPIYEFQCDKCDKRSATVWSMSNPPTESKCSCGGNKARQYGMLQVGAFRPFITDNITGKKMEIRTAAQRDHELGSRGLTMDTYRYNRAKVQYGSDQLTLKEVMEEHKKVDPREHVEVGITHEEANKEMGKEKGRWLK